MMNMNLTIISLAALAMNFCIVGAAEARAGSHKNVDIVNCAGQRMLVCTFNGKDSWTGPEHDFKRLPQGNKVKLNCHGDGKGGCKVKADSVPTRQCSCCHGKLWSGRHSKYYRLMGDGDDDLVQISESDYRSDSRCTAPEI